MNAQPLLMLDIGGTELTAEDRELLAHPGTGGLIFFSRNFESREQITALVKAIRAVRPEMLVAVDQEGGRVQRFRDGFTRLPPMRKLGERFDQDPKQAGAQAYQLGALMASELVACDIDISFAPVLDLDFGQSSVIGDRSFHTQAQAVTTLAGAFIDGHCKRLDVKSAANGAKPAAQPSANGGAPAAGVQSDPAAAAK